MGKRRRKKISRFTEMVHEINANQFFDKPLELKEGKQTYAKWEEKKEEPVKKTPFFWRFWVGSAFSS